VLLLTYQPRRRSARLLAALVAVAVIVLAGAIDKGVAQAGAASASAGIVALAEHDATRLSQAIQEAARATHGHKPSSVERDGGIVNVAYSAQPGRVARYGVYTFAASPYNQPVIIMYQLNRPWRGWYDPTLQEKGERFRLELVPTLTTEKHEPNDSLIVDYGGRNYRRYWAMLEPGMTQTPEEGQLTAPELEAAFNQGMEVIRLAERHAPLPRLPKVY